MTLFEEPTVVLAPPTAVFLIRWGSLCEGGVTPENINQWLWQECGFTSMTSRPCCCSDCHEFALALQSYLPKHLMRPHTTQQVVTNKLLQMDLNSAHDDHCALQQYTSCKAAASVKLYCTFDWIRAFFLLI